MHNMNYNSSIERQILLLLTIFCCGLMFSCEKIFQIKQNIALDKQNGQGNGKKNISARLANSNPVIIIKADDLGDVGPNTSNWSKFMKIVIDSNICASIGVISNTVSNPSQIKTYAALTQTNSMSPVFEFWNH